MHSDFIPKKEAGLRLFLSNLSTRLSATPSAFGVTAPEALQLGTALAAFETAYLAAHDPATRTHTAIVAKDTAKKSVVAIARALCRKVQATATVTNEQRAELQLPAHDVAPTPVPAPDTKPVLSLVAVSGNELWARVVDQMSQQSKAKPFGVIGCDTFAFVGDTPPTEFDQWKPMGLFTRATVHLVFESASAGKKISIVGRWITGRGLTGSFSDPISTRLPGAAVEAA